MYFKCPHCDGTVEINQINCGIFRHGILKINNQQINPHSPQTECQHLFDNNLIYGCGKPFQIKIINDKYEITACDYI